MNVGAEVVGAVAVAAGTPLGKTGAAAGAAAPPASVASAAVLGK
jgi:hypothetical protein